MVQVVHQDCNPNDTNELICIVCAKTAGIETARASRTDNLSSCNHAALERSTFGYLIATQRYRVIHEHCVNEFRAKVFNLPDARAASAR